MKPSPIVSFLAACLALTGCSDPVKEAQVAEKAAAQAETGITLPKTPVKGQDLNAFFPTDTEEDRRLLLEEFDLEGLAKKSQAQGTLGQP